MSEPDQEGRRKALPAWCPVVCPDCGAPLETVGVLCDEELPYSQRVHFHCGRVGVLWYGDKIVDFGQEPYHCWRNQLLVALAERDGSVPRNIVLDAIDLAIDVGMRGALSPEKNLPEIVEHAFDRMFPETAELCLATAIKRQKNLKPRPTWKRS